MNAFFSHIGRAALAACLFCLALALPVHAQEDDGEELGWTFSGELSAVLTAGNTETSTFGLNLGLVRAFERAQLGFKAGGLKVDTTSTRRRAVGVPGDFSILERSITETTAERYHLRGRYDHEVSERLFWYAGAGWERNQFAGFDSRSTVIGGLGHHWIDTESARFSTTYGVTYTEQDDIVPDPATSDGFAGLQVGYDYWRQLTDSTVFESVLTVDANIDESEDLRAEFVNALAVSIKEGLALRVALEVLYDNLPALEAVPLENALGVPTGDVVFLPLDDLDATLTVGVVLTR